MTVKLDWEPFIEAAFDLSASMTLLCSEIDGTRDQFVADGGDLEVISVIERAYEVGAHASTELQQAE